MEQNLPRGIRSDGSAVQIDPTLSLASWGDAERVFRSRREAIVRVDQPIILISQVQRSGGTLLNSLLDGHPELHVHPYELHIGYPTKADWPSLDLAVQPDAWLERLGEPVLNKLFAGGYRKKPDMDSIEDFPSLPFTVVPTFVDHLFRLLCSEHRPVSQREVIDRYMTAFFNAWLDNQGLRDEPKKWVAAFAPRTAWGQSRARFFGDYPDGRIVSMLRDPRDWYASASEFSGQYGDLEDALALWREGTTETAAAKRERPEQVFVIPYESLVRDPEPVMRRLATWLDISWSPSLLVPTFNRLLVRPNSSYDLAVTGIRTESVDRWRGALASGVAATIEERLLELHADVRAIADVA
jgi:hypothetical protein